MQSAKLQTQLQNFGTSFDTPETRDLDFSPGLKNGLKKQKVCLPHFHF